MKDDQDDIVFDEEIVPTDEAGAEKGFADKVKKLKEKVAELEAEKQEYLDGWQRARADYANLQKSTDDDKKRFKALFAERFVEDLIPAIDSFQMAMSNKESWEKVDPAWRSGVEYIYNQLIGALESHGLSLFGTAGEKFDPTQHEAVNEEVADSEDLDHTIAKVIQKGYMLGETVLRPARVTVWVNKK